MQHIRRAATAIALATAMTATAIPAATADRTSTADRRGDAPRAFDITDLRVWNNPRAVRIRLDFADLDRSRVHELSAQIDTGRRLGQGLYLKLERRDGRGWEKTLQEAPMYGEPGDETLPCATMTLDWNADAAVIRLPRRCIRDAGDRIRVAASVENARGTQGDNAPDAPRLFTKWVDRG